MHLVSQEGQLLAQIRDELRTLNAYLRDQQRPEQKAEQPKPEPEVAKAEQPERVEVRGVDVPATTPRTKPAARKPSKAKKK